MVYEVRDNTGSLFAVTEKGGDSHPDYNGSCKIGGKEIYISGWKKTSKNGKVYLSLSFAEKGKVKKKTDDKPPVNDGFEDSEIPF